MTKTNLLEATALRSAAIGLAVAFSTPAFAQETQTEEAQNPPESLTTEQEVESGQNATQGEEVVVTGSRIRRPNLESVVPVTSVGGQEFFETGQTSIGDTLNELPALRSTFSQANSTQFLGTSGLNLLDLRGLGTQRTLVLVNGRRHVASNVLGNAVEVDTNTIPTDLIERVDIVTGGNSAIYGSDAIAGVVNFVLKQDYEGFQIRGQGGISKYGDAGSYYVSALGGKNFAEGRGNVAVNVEYARQQDFYAENRGDCFATQCGFVTVDTDPASRPFDNVPDRVFLKDIRHARYTNGGAMYFCCDLLDPTDPLIGGSGYFTQPYKFLPNGDLAPITGQRVGTSYFGSFIGGNGNNFRDSHQFGLMPKLDRYSVNLIGHFEVTPSVVPFIEAKFSRTDSLGNASGPFFSPAVGELYPQNAADPARPGEILQGPNEGGTGIYPTFTNPFTGDPTRVLDREALFTDNPFLSAQARALIQSRGAGFYYQSYFYLFRNYVELGNREEKARRDTYRVVGGVRGDFNDDWSYEISANYGKLKEKTKILGNVNTQRYLLAIDAVDQGQFNTGTPNGNIVCRSQVDPNFALALQNNLDPTFAASQLAADVAACTPLNPFGEGNISQAAKNYVLMDSLAKGSINEFVLNAFVSGDTSEFLNLPGGPIGFALGAEHRTYDVTYRQDDFTKAGMTFYNAIPDFDPPSFRVNEIFGELRLPILKDQIVNEFTLNGAARYAKYKSFGGVWAYNAGAELSPSRALGLRLRGNFSRAVRAPSLADAYTPLGQNFAPAFTDPCDDDQVGAGNANRAANCAAAGLTGFDFTYSSSLGFLSGGNPDLKPETSDSLTLGGVWQPPFVPGVALSVDWYKIKVKDVITSPSAQAAVNACYDLPDLDNQFCSLFQRAGASGGPRGEIPGQILENSLELVPLNYAKLQVRGIDVEATYRKRFSFGDFNTRFVYTHVIQNDSFLDPTDPTFADQIMMELGDPQDAFNWDSNIKFGKFTFGYQMRYLSKMLLNTAEFEFFFRKQGRVPSNPDWAEQKFYPHQFYHDVRLAVDATKNLNMYVGVDDLTNNKPPLGATGIGDGSGIYRNIGRFFYAGVVAKF
jgi:outer membrane receptor protein involved in Fe transport